MKKILPPTYLWVSIVVMVALYFVFPGTRIIPSPWNWLGLIPLALGMAINVVADNTFKKVETTVKPFRESTVLVTDGAYRISRHPMYLGFVLILAGIAIILGSLTPWVVVPVFVILMESVFIRVEERMMEEQFGQAWLEYKARARRWI